MLVITLLMSNLPFKSDIINSKFAEFNKIIETRLYIQFRYIKILLSYYKSS